ncbi:MAG: NYN domain-containing protein, partial [Candidatus Kerfeldbacteria bacterium]|nr:NYN domain-containing protein [Candidatus Kerfeldbacteria bacterium]
IALDIDAENTTADIVNISAALLTTGRAIDIPDLDALTTGTGVNVVSNSSNTSERYLVNIVNDNTLATSATALRIQQDAAAANALITTGGLVGFGTTAPIQEFHLVGQCVTGDTRLRRRRRRKNKKGEWTEKWENVPITDIQSGDEILSLNEKTGRFVWRRVKNLMAMGVKPIYHLTTEDGRSIRTTGNHPYLVQKPSGRAVKHTSPLPHAGWITADDLKPGDHIAAPKPKIGLFVDDANLYHAQKKAGWRLDYHKIRQQLAKHFDVRFVNYYAAEPAPCDTNRAKSLRYFGKIRSAVTLKLKQLKYIKAGSRLIPKGDVDVDIAMDVARRINNLDVVAIMSGDSDYIPVRDYALSQGKKVIFLAYNSTMAWELRQGKYVSLDTVRAHVELGSNKKTTPEYDLGRLLLSLLYGSQDSLSSSKSTGFMWVKIAAITQQSPEQVYDIEVEHTHNFVGNDIVAHNTFIDSNASDTVAIDVDAENTTTDVLNIAATVLTTGRAIDLPDLDALTTGTGINVVSNSSDTSERYLVNIDQDNSSASGARALRIKQDAAQTAQFIDQNGNGLSLEIDSEATTADIVSLDGSALTSGNLIQATVADTLATDTALINITGTALNTATLVKMLELSATAANDVDIALVHLERGANDARIVYDEGDDVWKLDQGTGSGLVNIATGTTVTLQQAYDNDADGSDATIALTSADDSLIISNPSSSGTDSSFAFQINQDATGVIALDIDAENTTADIVNISAALLTTGRAIDIPDLDALTTGTGINVVSNSSNTSERYLVNIVNDNT